MPDGTTYYFWSPYSSDFTAASVGYAGLLNAIFGRDHNNVIGMNYFFSNNDASDPNFITQIVEQAEDGTSATYVFTTINGFKELTSLTRPDGTIVQYTYNDNAYSNNVGNNLWLVQRPGNNYYASLPEVYSYTPGTYQLNGIQDPRSVKNFPNEGGQIAITYDGSQRVRGVVNSGVVNFSPQDTTAQYLQPNFPVGYTSNASISLTYLNGASSYQPGVTQYRDSNNHQIQYSFDTIGRLSSEDLLLNGNTMRRFLSWTSQNQLSAATDMANANNLSNFSNNTSNYDYNAQGNLVASAGPQVSVQGGSFRPTKLMAYDGYNNRIAACDEVWVHAHGMDWGNGYQPGVSTCPQQSGATQYIWGTAPYEPYGRLNGVITPRGYITTINYAYGSQDIGKPVNSSGASFTENDGTRFNNYTTYSYTSAGNLSSVTTPTGTSSSTYNAIGQLLVSHDADGVQTASNTYYPDGSLQTATPQGWTQIRTYSYDADGNLIDLKDSATGYETKHWYDAYGRLVETQQPAAPFSGLSLLSGSNATLPLLERYIYDDSNGAGNPVPYGPTPPHQFGGLYAVQRYTGAVDGNSWQTEEEMSYDELGRLAAHVSRGSCGSVTYIAGPLFCGALNSFQVNTFDPVTGRLSVTALPSGTVVGFAYDARAQLIAKQFYDNKTPAETYSYDASGRIVSGTTAAISGSQTYTYDADGNLIQSQEPSGNDAHGILYTYYPDDTRSNLTVSGPVLNASSLLSYNYRSDGLLSHLTIGNGSNQSLAYFYTPAGRLSFRDDLLNRAATGTRYTQTLFQTGSTNSKVVQYDGLGRISAYALPQGAYTNFTYTPDGQVASYSGYGVSVLATYGLRRQLNGIEYVDSNGTRQTQFPNFTTTDQAGFDDPSPDTQWNFLNSQVLATASLNPTWDSSGRVTTLIGKDSTGATAISESNQYDGVNRLTSESVANWGSSNLGPNFCYNGSASMLRTVAAQETFSYLWGINGHPVQQTHTINGNTTVEHLHWDGDQLLFSDNGSSVDVTIQ